MADSFLTVLIPALHWLFSLVILAEAMNKLERTDPFQPGLSARARLVVWAKALAWVLLGLASGCALLRPGIAHLMQAKWVAVGPFLLLNRPSAMDVAHVAGFAILIVRSRLKENRHELESQFHAG